MQLSTLIGKQILSPAGEKLGYTKTAYLTRDLKKLSALGCIDAEEEEFFLPARAVRAAGDVIIARSARLAAPTGVQFPSGVPAYSDGGEFLGAVADHLYTEGEPSQVLLVKDGARTAYPVESISLGETLIVSSSPAKKRPSVRKKPRDVVSKRAPSAEEKPAPPPAPPATTAPDEGGAPSRSAEPLPCRNLLGRTVKKSVLDRFGVPIALAGETITPSVLSRARRENMLLRLTVNTLMHTL